MLEIKNQRPKPRHVEKTAEAQTLQAVISS
jgi:hypothetical protein